MRRRAFLSNAGLAASAALLLPRKKLLAAHLKHFALGVITDEVHEDVETALEFASQFGLDWVELRGVWGRNVTDIDEPTLTRLKGLLRSYGLRVSVVDTALFKTTLPGTHPSQRQRDSYPYSEQFDLLKRGVEKAAALNAPYLRIFDFWRCREQKLIMDDICAHLLRAVELARPAGVRLLLENEHTCHTATGEELALLGRRIVNPYLGFIWDPLNCLLAGANPYPEEYEKIDRARIIHVHVKDGMKLEEPESYRAMRVGTGQVDWVGQFSALLHDGYRGTLSLETHYDGADGTRYSASLESMVSIMELIKMANG